MYIPTPSMKDNKPKYNFIFDFKLKKKSIKFCFSKINRNVCLNALNFSKTLSPIKTNKSSISSKQYDLTYGKLYHTNLVKSEQLCILDWLLYSLKIKGIAKTVQFTV